jgi:hypothetical protein
MENLVLEYGRALVTASVPIPETERVWQRRAYGKGFKKEVKVVIV